MFRIFGDQGRTHSSSTFGPDCRESRESIRQYPVLCNLPMLLDPFTVHRAHAGSVNINVGQLNVMCNNDRFRPLFPYPPHSDSGGGGGG